MLSNRLGGLVEVRSVRCDNAADGVEKSTTGRGGSVGDSSGRDRCGCMKEHEEESWIICARVMWVFEVGLSEAQCATVTLGSRVCLRRRRC
jgi:hypothetical protein